MKGPKSYTVDAAAAPFLQGRFDAAFPTLTREEIERTRRFGSVRHFAAGDYLFEAGRPKGGMFVVLSGHVAITTRDGLGHTSAIVEQGPGQFIAELGTLTDEEKSLTYGQAEGPVDTLLILPAKLRALIVEEAELGARMMRALILRRFALTELGEGGPVLIGSAGSADVARLEEFLRRNGYPHRVLDPATDAAAAEVVARLSPAPSELPLVICPAGEIVRNPSESAFPDMLGLVWDRLTQGVYDVGIIGCGPAGLSAAVYAASEGLSTVVLDEHAFGGQAGASARIENYLGFPTGISGLALTARAYAQARKFGTEIAIPVKVTGLDCTRRDGSFHVLLQDSRYVRARTIVIASGARYRRPAIENLAEFEGRGVWYWASPFEAKLCAKQEIILVGGGNSAGQAAVFLSGHAAKVRMMIRGLALSEKMSQYLVQRIAAASNIEVMTETELVALQGSPERGLERVRWRSHRDGVETTAPIAHVFLFLGADPATSWLADCAVALDPHGFVITGDRHSPLQTSVPGIFAAGDVRLGSTKRVGSAIGEGAQAIAAIHSFVAAEVSHADG
jgi:thioredoxin reductase (NADPH)